MNFSKSREQKVRFAMHAPALVRDVWWLACWPGSPTRERRAQGGRFAVPREQQAEFSALRSNRPLFQIFCARFLLRIPPAAWRAWLLQQQQRWQQGSSRAFSCVSTAALLPFGVSKKPPGHQPPHTLQLTSANLNPSAKFSTQQHLCDFDDALAMCQ